MLDKNLITRTKRNFNENSSIKKGCEGSIDQKEINTF